MTDQSGRIINQKINILPNNNSLDFKNDPRPGCLPNDMWRVDYLRDFLYREIVISVIAWVQFRKKHW